MIMFYVICELIRVILVWIVIEFIYVYELVVFVDKSVEVNLIVVDNEEVKDVYLCVVI